MESFKLSKGSYLGPNFISQWKFRLAVIIGVIAGLFFIAGGLEVLLVITDGEKMSISHIVGFIFSLGVLVKLGFILKKGVHGKWF